MSPVLEEALKKNSHLQKLCYSSTESSDFRKGGMWQIVLAYLEQAAELTGPYYKTCWNDLQDAFAKAGRSADFPAIRDAWYQLIEQNLMYVAELPQATSASGALQSTFQEEQSRLCIRLPKGTKIYRLRTSAERIGTIDDGDEDARFSQLTAAPSKYAKANRYSPECVSYFYGSNCEELAQKEVQWEPNFEDYLYTAQFELIHDIDILNLVSWLKPVGNFDPDCQAQYHLYAFREALAEAMWKDNSSTAIKTQSPQEYYVPQLVCQLPQIRYKPALIGIQYRSIHDKERAECYNYVFFFDGDKSRQYLRLVNTTVRHHNHVEVLM